MQDNYNLVRCKVCGKLYKACKNCAEGRGMGSWRAVCDTAEHYKIYLTAHAVELGNITAEDALAQLDRCNLDDMESFEPPVLAVLEKILAAEEEHE